MQRSTMQEVIAAPQVGGIVRLTGFILRATLVIEPAGTAIMAPVFCRDFALAQGFGMRCSIRSRPSAMQALT